MTGTAPVKRRMFFLVVHGVISDEPSTILKITQDSTAHEVIVQALNKSNRANENPNDYVLLEEVGKGWDKKFLNDRTGVHQRILDPNERPLEAQSQWKGDGRFQLKKLGDDPSTRAWMSNIRLSSANKNKKQDEPNADWEDSVSGTFAISGSGSAPGTFLVCIYNVSADQPYTILKAPIEESAPYVSAQDIISQALVKAHRQDEDPKNFVLIEEIENFDSGQSDLPFSFKPKSGHKYRRVVGDYENIYEVQTQWNSTQWNRGKFELKSRKDVSTNDNTFAKNGTASPATSRLLRGRDSFRKLSQIHRTYSKKLTRKDGGIDSQSPAPSRRSTTSSQRSTTPLTTPVKKSDSAKATAGEATPKKEKICKKDSSKSDDSRLVHSEGELPSDDDDNNINETRNEDSKPETPFHSSLSRLKKLSLKRLKVWKN